MYTLTLVERIDAEYGREVQSLADMTDTENIQGIIKEIVRELFSKGIIHVYIIMYSLAVSSWEKRNACTRSLLSKIRGFYAKFHAYYRTVPPQTVYFRCNQKQS